MEPKRFKLSIEGLDNIPFEFVLELMRLWLMRAEQNWRWN